MTIKNRLKRIEQAAKRKSDAPKINTIEIYGTREDGTKYLIETWQPLVEAKDISPREGWQRFISQVEEK